MLASIQGISDNTAAFKIGTGYGIPDGKYVRTSDRIAERMESLMRVPRHKSARKKFTGDPADRTIAPLTHEDTTQFANLPLITTLRES